eukprot:TRINITY_DN7772_c0_g1_i1.p1 TRINITY_DN7772_c0_g1~~TRINITY_DN7772_c0_g1_i1.p1  ORF type:complete len:486 (+),score=185.97 TRINITY_DN7772_c0_g1_i1:92-1459(+)
MGPKVRQGRVEMLGRIISLVPLLADEDVEAILALAIEAAKRAPSAGAARFQDPAAAPECIVQRGLLPFVAPPGGGDVRSPSAADAETAARKNMVSFCFGGATGAEEAPAVADDDDEEEDGGRRRMVTETDERMDMRMGNAYKGMTRDTYRQGRRKTVSSEVINLEDIEHYQPPVHAKSKDDEAFLRSMIRDEYLFEHLEDFELDVLIQAMFRQDLHSGDSIFTEGETGDTYKILQEGTAQITESHLDGKGFFVVENVGPGWKRGEEDLMYAADAPQTVTVTSERAKVWCLQRQPYRFIVTKASIKKRQMYEEFLSKISFLKGMSNFARLQVADALKPTTFHQGDKLISFGDEGRYFFIIVEGVVKVIGREGDRADDPKKHVCDFSVGDCVGELEFVHGHRCVADVVAATPIVRCAKMGKRHFEKVMGPVEDVLKQRAMEDTKFAYYRGTGVASPQ